MAQTSHLDRRRRAVLIILSAIAIVGLVLGTYYLIDFPANWAAVQEFATFASGVGVAIFTGVVALVEVTRFLQGPKILVSVESVIELVASPEYLMPPRYNAISEQVSFEFPLVLSNTGPRGGAITSLDILLVNPPHVLPTTREGKESEDRVESEWRAGEVLFQPVFISGRTNTLSLRDNESKAMKVQVTLALREKNWAVFHPTNTFGALQEKYPDFQFEMHYRATSGRGGREVVRKREFRIRPKYVLWEDKMGVHPQHQKQPSD